MNALTLGPLAGCSMSQAKSISGMYEVDALQIIRGSTGAHRNIYQCSMQQIYLLYLVELVRSWAFLAILRGTQNPLDPAIYREN